jgi:hypothetical protein
MSLMQGIARGKIVTDLTIVTLYRVTSTITSSMRWPL